MQTSAEDPQRKNARPRRQYSPKVRLLAEQLVNLSQEEADEVCRSLKERMTAVSNRQSGEQKRWQPRAPGNFTFFPHPLGIFAATTGSFRVVGVRLPSLPVLSTAIMYASRQEGPDKSGASDGPSHPVAAESESAVGSSAHQPDGTSQAPAETSP
ncbi:hypothetical protein NCLIV_060070 [Neospora caninum Liverpool]|nr:hypothetical protein NCLIV_060070 [Neospora caninum Liverpool]CBZ55583.1 hypothetical protein NCLIV_060070 [Neospora caninum Liverpool]|eukprot:XP_003885611.1 hypothetical protein NCLIV_060070 [Neospora caninum Liverpool]